VLDAKENSMLVEVLHVAQVRTELEMERAARCQLQHMVLRLQQSLTARQHAGSEGARDIDDLAACTSVSSWYRHQYATGENDHENQAASKRLIWGSDVPVEHWDT
jgi:hypothetical protein